MKTHKKDDLIYAAYVAGLLKAGLLVSAALAAALLALAAFN